MKRGRVFPLLVCFVLCVILLRSANAAPTLELKMEFNSGTSTVEVHRTNTDFGLGSLTYNMLFSESLNLSREYSDYGWVANDGLFDGSTPGDGSTGSYPSILFDTVHSPAGTEFTSGTSGVVESLTILDLSPRWIYFDILLPVIATNGAGVNILQLPGGSAPIVIPDPDGQGHTLAVYIPEPATMLLLSLGGIFTLSKRKK